jgi:uncharacterized protein (DUF885 family)
MASPYSRTWLIPGVCAFALGLSTRHAPAQAATLPVVSPVERFGLKALPESELESAIALFAADAAALRRSYPVRLSAARHARLKTLYNDWLAGLDALDFAGLSHTGQVDYLLFGNYLKHELRQLDIQEGYQDEAAPLLPFAPVVVELAGSRRRMERVKGEQAAATLTDLAKQIADVRAAVEAGLRNGDGGTKRGTAATSADDAPSPGARSTSAPASQAAPIRVKKTVANRAGRMARDLRNNLADWHEFHNGYDPMFAWWIAEPYKDVDKALNDYARFLREKVVGVPEDDNKTIIGDPIGREALLAELQFEMIPYTPEELIEIAAVEFRWCREEMLKASREMGLGDDWRAALEQVKQDHVQPGEQPALVKQLAQEAIAFLDEHDLVTVPELCREVWRMDMMSPQQQMLSPFFLGGEVIQVAFPTDAMSHEAKLMTLRGNNRHFAHATVFHELVPGHHLQGFMNRRYRPYREIFDTPFWVEGWALYWEMLMWDLGFHQTPEDRVGALFWRSHRCVRIIFSLSFHLERMTPQECVDMLVNEVGHERANAEAEVRRSFEGDYGPLYQAAYMLGGLQIRALRRELVDSGKMTNRQFHDAILHENSIPIEMVRAILTQQPLTKDFTTAWRFAGID